MQISFDGILIALFSYIVIGLFHPIVIKCEYYFSDRIWPIFLASGILLLVASLFTSGMVSILLSLIGAAYLWSIRELKEQANRVKKGWFPKNPNRENR